MSETTKKAIVYFPRLAHESEMSLVACKASERFASRGAVVVHTDEEVRRNRDANLLYLDPFDRNRRASWNRLALMMAAAWRCGFEIELETV